MTNPRKVSLFRWSFIIEASVFVDFCWAGFSVRVLESWPGPSAQIVTATDGFPQGYASLRGASGSSPALFLARNAIFSIAERMRLTWDIKVPKSILSIVL